MDGLLAGEGHPEGMAALKACRRFFSAQGYWASLIPCVRRTIGSHYDESAVADLVQAEFTNDQLLESTAASVGGLARMADPIVRAIMTRLNGGDFMSDETQTQRIPQALGRDRQPDHVRRPLRRGARTPPRSLRRTRGSSMWRRSSRGPPRPSTPRGRSCAARPTELRRGCSRSFPELLPAEDTTPGRNAGSAR